MSRDRGRQHHLAPLRRGGQHRPLRGKGHRSEERPDRAIPRQAFGQQRLGAPDLALAGQKDQQAAAAVAGLGLGPNDEIDQCLHPPRLRAQRPVQPARLDRKGASLGRDQRRRHQLGHRACVERR